jgi:methylglutaconyl-CoA hydratase
MRYETIIVSENGGHVDIELNRPEIHNAFNEVMIHEITDVCKALSKNKKVSVVSFSSKAKSFCAGADLNWMKKMKDYSKADNIKDAKKLYKMLDSIFNLPQLTIAKVNGAAFGGGVGLISTCDYVLCLEEARFGLTEVNLGLAPAVISPFVLFKIGPSWGRGLFTTGLGFTAQTAQMMGLVHELSSGNDFEQRFQKIILHSLSSGPKAKRQCKTLIPQDKKLFSNKHLDFITQMISELRVSAEGQEGMSALLEKRKPEFK